MTTRLEPGWDFKAKYSIRSQNEAGTIYPLSAPEKSSSSVGVLLFLRVFLEILQTDDVQVAHIASND